MLASELRDPVRRDRARGDALRGRVLLGLAVDRRGGSEDDAYAVARGRLEEALRREQVAVEVGLEDIAEAPHARLAREVEDAVDPPEVDRVAREVEPEDLLPARVLLLQLDIVVIGEAVDPDDVVPEVAQRGRKVRADEPGRAGDDEAHRRNCRDNKRRRVLRSAAGRPRRRPPGRPRRRSASSIRRRGTPPRAAPAARRSRARSPAPDSGYPPRAAAGRRRRSAG